jgi:hypothetical protein
MEAQQVKICSSSSNNNNNNNTNTNLKLLKTNAAIGLTKYVKPSN